MSLSKPALFKRIFQKRRNFAIKNFKTAPKLQLLDRCDSLHCRTDNDRHEPGYQRSKVRCHVANKKANKRSREPDYGANSLIRLALRLQSEPMHATLASRLAVTHDCRGSSQKPAA
jgi:hypothetical protein